MCMLLHHRGVPAAWFIEKLDAELAQELELRIESWVLDIDGRRDFQHALNVNIRKWIREHLLGAARGQPSPPPPDVVAVAVVTPTESASPADRVDDDVSVHGRQAAEASSDAANNSREALQWIQWTPIAGKATPSTALVTAMMLLLFALLLGFVAAAPAAVLDDAAPDAEVAEPVSATAAVAAPTVDDFGSSFTIRVT
eukprot:gene35693-42212_t